MQNLAGPNGDPDDELLSLALVKHGTHVICGTQSGSLNIFKRGAWDDPARKMTGASLISACILNRAGQLYQLGGSSQIAP